MRQLLRASLVNYIVRNRDIAGAEMTLFERYPVIARPLYGLLAALLGAAAILTIVNYAGSPTDENLFADMPRPMSLYVMKPIPHRGTPSARGT
jgi:hypothetical protein